ncbi:Cys-tRNA(Pro) deacylase [Flexivirga sp. ID2601S]|uniref:Cys-tRNA(Pro)/Cys-tRNA(Cys) deacylase n=1 Tax=Flexivirga aerilata TaxID=1656889 RepID=A0A849AN98_9MICO|nr:Cys-tRNA(Pro) deacylase [Flexivirga aerilata]NNG40976.1 Cys-tRNA(Pro) deacylase [Flexivirga aerilata]
MAVRKNHADASSTPAIAALRSAGVHFELRAYEHDPDMRSFGAEAAAELGVEPDRVFKTLVVQTDRTADKGLVVAVVPVAGQLDLKALAREIGCKKAALADPALAARVTGYLVGGISPIGQKRRLHTVVDEGALRHPTILVSGGRRGLDVALSPADLIAVTGAVTGTIAT